MWAYSLNPGSSLPNMQQNGMPTIALPNIASQSHFSSDHFNSAPYSLATSDHSSNNALATAHHGANVTYNVGLSFHQRQALSQVSSLSSSPSVHP